MADGDIRWWQRGAIYQIYPRSFADSDGNGVGDLRGITERLDYLNDGTERSLGVEAIWLSPIYSSPMADFGYDISDYTDVDPLFGSLADFDTLLQEAHTRGIKVVLDWVPNHTSDRHPWFLESRAGPEGPKRDWYVWREPGPAGGPPNNWRSSFEAVGAAWTHDSKSGQYYLHSFTPQQPDLNWDNPEVEKAMHDVLRFWLERGVDGFRLDVIQKIAKDPELRDNPGDSDGGAEMRHDQDWPTIQTRLRRIRSVVDEYDDRMLVGEVHIYDLGRFLEYINTGDQLHLAHNFMFLQLPWEAAAIRASVDDFESLNAGRAWPAWFLSNHDHSRMVTRHGGGELGEARARVAAMLLYTLRGTPFVYQGEELALPDAEIPPEARVDVDGRDPERAPIPWLPPSEAGAGAGFSTHEPWLPPVADAERLCVRRQLEDPASPLSLVRRLSWRRRNEPCLQRGEQRSVDAGRGIFGYLRELDGDSLLVLLNFEPEPSKVEVSGLPEKAEVELSTDPERKPGTVTVDGLELCPNEGMLLRLPSSRRE
ncbi:MAG: alpha-amylase family glycosyl hydrolase [Solirubrobacterales bacterium]